MNPTMAWAKVVRIMSLAHISSNQIQNLFVIMAQPYIIIDDNLF
jgi:hypothetical protein